MNIIYIGTSRPGVIVYPVTGGEIYCQHDKSTQVPDTLGKGLLDQPINWKKKRGRK